MKKSEYLASALLISGLHHREEPPTHSHIFVVLSNSSVISVQLLSCLSLPMNTVTGLNYYQRVLATRKACTTVSGLSLQAGLCILGATGKLQSRL